MSREALAMGLGHFPKRELSGGLSLLPCKGASPLALFAGSAASLQASQCLSTRPRADGWTGDGGP